MIQLKKIIKIIPKLDPIVETITTSAKQKKIAKLIIRAIQIGAVVYLLSKGLIDDEQAIEIIKYKSSSFHKGCSCVFLLWVALIGRPFFLFILF